MPIMQQRRDLWPADCCGFRDFQYAAGMVQSRSFHIRSHNWITGERTEGETAYSPLHGLVKCVTRGMPGCPVNQCDILERMVECDAVGGGR